MKLTTDQTQAIEAAVDSALDNLGDTIREGREPLEAWNDIKVRMRFIEFELDSVFARFPDMDETEARFHAETIAR